MPKHFLLIIFLFSIFNLKSQTKFYATVSANEIGKDDYLQLKLIIENANEVQKVSNPMLTNFTIESGPNEETGVSVINGKTKKYLALNYIVKPKAVGTFIIPSVIAIADGKEYKSESVSVKVLNKSTINNKSQQSLLDVFESESQPKLNIADYTIKENEDVYSKVKQNLFVKTFVDKKQAYVGEPIGVTYKLYTRLKSESNIVKNPAFNGFSVVDMPIGSVGGYSIEKINGKEYNVYTLRKAQLFPLQAGVLPIEKIEIENVITFIKESYIKKRKDNFFDDFGEAPIPADALLNKKINIESETVNLNIKPLPANNIPKSFKGAVGNFTIATKLANEDVFTNTANKLIITIEGEGNLHLLNTPEVKWPNTVENFEPIVTEDIDNTTQPLRGGKTFTIPFLVSDTGVIIIDSIAFSFFDVKTGLYKKINTLPFKVSVKKGSVNTNVTNTNSKVGGLSKFTINRRWLVSFLVIAISLGLFFWYKKDKKNKIKNAIENIEDNGIDEIAVQKDWLYNTKQLLNTTDENNFYKTLNADFVEFLADRFKIDIALVNKQNILHEIIINYEAASAVNEVNTILNLLNDKLYNPLVNVDANLNKEEVYSMVKNIVEKLS